MSLERRIQDLEVAMEGEDGPPLAQRLQDAMALARERRRQGQPASDPAPAGEGPLVERLRRARQRAEGLRQQLAG